MLLLVTFLRIALSAVFAVAGVTKLTDQPGTRDALRNFGAPQSALKILAVILPLTELSIAIGLIVNSTVWPSSIAALVLLCLFIVAISVNLIGGQKHDCHCFGQLYSRPLGAGTLIRNLIFAAGAGVVIWASGNFVSQIGLDTTQSLIALGIVVALATGAVYLQSRRAKSQPTTPRPKGLPVDSQAPAFDLVDYDGGRKTLTDLLDYRKSVLLIFTNPHCSPCISLFKEIREWQDAHEQRLTIALISQGTIKENFVNVARNRLGSVLLQDKREIAERYGATLTPTALLVSTEGKIASDIAVGGDEIRDLLGRVTSDGE